MQAFQEYVGTPAEFAEEYPTASDRLDGVRHWYTNFGEGVDDQAARYREYQMPGGDNYRELLLKVPLELPSTDFRTSHWPNDPNTLMCPYVLLSDTLAHTPPPSKRMMAVPNNSPKNGFILCNI